MLEALHIKNFVLINVAEAWFQGGFCVFTGETGAGKSILVDALQAVCGSKNARAAAGDGIRNRPEISVEFGVARNARAREWLRDNALEDEDSDSVVVRRVLGEQEGKRSRCYINGKPVTLGQARELASLLIDIHGQHDSLRLLEPHHQRDFLDHYAGCADLRRETGRKHAQLSEMRRRREELAKDSRQREELAERLRADLSDLEAIGFSAAKWKEVDERLRRHHGAAELKEGLGNILDLLGGEDGAIARLESARKTAGNISKRDARAESLAQQLDQALELAGDLTRETSALADGSDESPEGIADGEEFLSEAHRLMRRHKLISPDALEQEMDRMSGELRELESVADPEALAEQIAALEEDLLKTAERLTRKRRAAAKKISRAVTEALPKLGMSGGSFSVGLEDRESVAADGKEQVRFLISTHKGSKPGDLRSVASGGELSRVGLAIMTQLGAETDGRTMVFDEVDAGIGGEVATVVGRVLKDLASKCGQVLCVTHLPQIASLADEHWGLEADREGDKPHVRLSRLSGEERKSEMVRMLGGERGSDTARRHADSLLQMGRGNGSDRSSRR